jgi:hypothetical protein
MRVPSAFALAALLAASLPAPDASAQAARAAVANDPSTFSAEEVVENGHRFFGSVSRGLALAVQEPPAAGASRTATSWARKPPRR